VQRQPHPGEASRSIEPLLADFQHALALLQQLTAEFADRVRVLDASPPRSVVSIEDERGYHVQIFTLGTFEVSVNARRVPLPPTGRPVAVLKLLADRGGRPTPRELLAEMLWPGTPSDTGANRLRVAIHSLRQIDDDLHDLVQFDQGTYQLTGSRVEIDADRFEGLLAGAHSLEQSGDLERALTVYGEAEALYRGDYFEDDLYEDWALVRRQHLRDLYLNLLIKLALLALERGDDEACISHCHEIVRQDSCSEDAYRLLMIAHGRRGNRARALRWYTLCEQALRRELDVEPSGITRGLRQEILAEAPGDGRSLRQRLGL
jgi:DNA-binding SARP family transcriptional activator